MISLKQEQNSIAEAGQKKEWSEVRSYLRHWNNLVLDDKDILYKKTTDENIKQFVIPFTLRPFILNELHVNLRHVSTLR